MYHKYSSRHDLFFDAEAMNAKSLLGYVDVDHGEIWTRVKHKAALVANLLFKIVSLCNPWKLNMLKQQRKQFG